MRLLTLLTLAALSACAPRAPSTCDLSFDREVAFTAPDAADTVTVRTFGPACDRATGLFTVADANGDPLWAWAAPMHHAFGDAFAGADGETMQAFLERWSQPTISRTSEAPAWPLQEGSQTTLDQQTYEDVRARDLPMLCHLSGTALEACVFWEPAAAGAGHYFDRDVTEPGRTDHETD